MGLSIEHYTEDDVNEVYGTLKPKSIHIPLPPEVSALLERWRRRELYDYSVDQVIKEYSVIANHELTQDNEDFKTLEQFTEYVGHSGLEYAEYYCCTAYDRFEDILRSTLLDMDDRYKSRWFRRWVPNYMALSRIGGPTYEDKVKVMGFKELMEAYAEAKQQEIYDDERQRSLDEKHRQQEVKDNRVRDLRLTAVELATTIDPCLLRTTAVESFDKIDDESVLQSEIERYTQEIERRGEQ